MTDEVAEVAVLIPDRPGEIAAIATLASELDVNILDLDITHSGEGGRGVMLLMVDRKLGERLVGGLMVGLPTHAAPTRLMVVPAR
ncbi:MAG: hypothetical protein R2710_22435 [Acidimicrobiales bacterium]